MRLGEIIDYARLLAGDPHGDLHDDAKMLLHGNTACRDISSRSRCIVGPLYMPAREGQSIYGLPEGFLRADIAAWVQPDGRYRPMAPVTMDVASWAIHNQVTGRPRYYDIFGRAAIERAVETVASVDAQANSFTWTLGEWLDIKVRDHVINVSDGSSTAFVAWFRNDLDDAGTRRQTIGYTPLDGGTRKTLQAGDQIRILSPGSHLHSLVVSPVPTEVGEIGAESLFLYIARTHRHISAVDVGNENDDIELDIEFEEALRERIVYLMRRDELGLKDPETQAQLVVAESAYQDALPDVLKRIRAWKRMWLTRQGLPVQPTLNAPVRVRYPVGIGSDGEVR